MSIVSPEEFAAKSEQEKIELVFEHFDADKDGYLSPSEFLELLKATNPGESGMTMMTARGTLDMLSKSSVFKYEASADRGLSKQGLIYSYTRVPGNDIDKDARTLGWLAPTSA